MHRTIVPLLLALAIVASSSGARADTIPQKPSLYLFLERSALREEDTVMGELWIANEGDLPITATARYIAPRFLALLDSGGRAVGAILLGTIPPHASARARFELGSAPDIAVGSFGISFVVEYTWAGGGSFVTAEKGVTMSLLGTDSIAGVPLALAGLIVPGLLFWVVVGWFGVAWARTGLGDITLYSIPVSLLFMVIGRWAPVMEVGGGIGVVKLGVLALGGGALGAIAGGIDRWIGERRRRKLAALVIADADTMPTRLRKLAARCRYDGPRRMRVTVEGESGGAYTGAWVARDDGCTYLFGSFHIDTDALPSNVRSALKKKMCDAAGGTDPHERLVKLLDLVEEGVKAGAVVKDLFKVTNNAKADPDDGNGRSCFTWGDDDGKAPDASPLEGVGEELVAIECS